MRIKEIGSNLWPTQRLDSFELGIVSQQRVCHLKKLFFVNRKVVCHYIKIFFF